MNSISGNQLGRILQSALSESQRAAQSYSGLSSDASSSSSACSSASSDSSEAAWDTAEKDVSSVGSSLERELDSVRGSHSRLESLLSEANSGRSSCSQDLRRALSEVDGAGLSEADKSRVTSSINQALMQDSQVSYAEGGTSSSLDGAERSVTRACDYAQEVSNDREGEDVSSAGSSLGHSASDAASEYSQVSSSASNCSSYQSRVSEYIQEALFANVPSDPAISSQATQESSPIQFPPELTPSILPPHPLAPSAPSPQSSPTPNPFFPSTLPSSPSPNPFFPQQWSQQPSPSQWSQPSPNPFFPSQPYAAPVLGWQPAFDNTLPGFGGYLFSGRP